MINILIYSECSRLIEIIKNIVERFYCEINFKDFNIQMFNDSKEIIKYIKSSIVGKRIYILDNELNERRDGLLLGKKIRELDNYRGVMILITNYPEISFKVFQYKLQVLALILKNYELSKHIKESISIATNILYKDIQVNREKKLRIRAGVQILNILIKDIIYVETIKNSKKIMICTTNNRIEFYSTLKELSNFLDNKFIQVHKTTIVNKNYIKSINKNRKNLYIELQNGIICPLSRNGLKKLNDRGKILLCG
ncbi:accessory regulator protein A [Clostridium tepidiprofundi DSM 19306]|uniref:Accessory regulator protein A n=1 Tax=Clostridium tepidiprofundi DSM 19306 TaxID=1121338 RepID=A0A151B206_9CLOT|nr:LytTR family DNA-binding domain-containing protein [Clostridium tepidiprofundi]KYH33945.1 accessory regulator protein A [Clostridium tepidiprofundi DSM 19306]